jgi:hypothetical protein
VAADAGDHAERAAVVASVLHFEVGASAVGWLRFLVCRFEDGGGEEFGVGEDVGDEDGVLSSQFPVLSESRDGEERPGKAAGRFCIETG